MGANNNTKGISGRAAVFAPGFRIDAKDVVVLVIGAVSSTYVLRIDAFLALVIAFALGHFFLFCNVLRMARYLELIWATVFVLLCASTIALGQPHPALAVSGVLLTTLLVSVLQLRSPSYHGIAWQRVNPGLVQWWERQGHDSTHAPHSLTANGHWTQEGRKRDCYCGLWDSNPQHFTNHQLPQGFCGVCDRCGAPGHTRHFPGPVPVTGAWCDRCYQIVCWTWPLYTPAGWLRIAIGVGILWALWPLLVRLFTS